MDRNRLIIAVGILLLLVIGGGVTFYEIVIAKSAAIAPAVSALPKAGDSASPFGKSPAADSGAAATGSGASAPGIAVVGTRGETVASQDVGALRIISANLSGPTAMTGAAAFLKGKTAEMVRFAEQGTGNIYETDLAAGTTSRLTLTTIPKIIESVWTPDGRGVYMRFLKDGTAGISTLYVSLAGIGATTTDANIPSSALAQDILGIAAQGSNALMLGKNAGGAFIIENDLAGKKKGTTVWRSPLSEWNLAWPKADLAVLGTKPAASVPGFLYFLNPSTEKTAIVLQDIKGLSALASPDGTKVLYSDTQNGALETKILTAATGKIDAFPVATLAEKCVWGVKEKTAVYCAVPTNLTGNIPDDWYRGTKSFADQIWKVDLKTGAATAILAADPKNPLDAENLTLSPNEDYLVFTHKSSLILWSLRLI